MSGGDQREVFYDLGSVKDGGKKRHRGQIVVPQNFLVVSAG